MHTRASFVRETTSSELTPVRLPRQHGLSLTSSFARCWVLLVIIVVCSNARGGMDSVGNAEIQSPASLGLRVETFITEAHAGSEVGINVAPVDPRLRLRRCPQPLDAEWSAGSRMLGRVAVLVSCPVDTGWRVRLQAEVVVYTQAWILVRSVQRGEQLTRGQIRAERVALGGNNLNAHAGNPVQTIDGWLGMRFRSAQRSGAVLFDKMLEATELIQRGDTVQVVSQRAGITVATDAEALSSGVQGARIRLKNRRSGVTFDATVTGRATARIE